MGRCVATFGYEQGPEVFLGRQRVVSRAAQRDVCGDICAVLRERLQVVKLEVAGLATALAARVDVRAAAGVPR